MESVDLINYHHTFVLLEFYVRTTVEVTEGKYKILRGDSSDGLTPWWEQMREDEEPGQVLRLKVVTGRQRRSKHIMFGPHGVPSST